MAQIDSILRLVVAQRGTELRIHAGAAPRLLRDGEPLTLTMPKLSDDMLEGLLGDLLTDAQQDELAAGEEVVFAYGGRGLGTFWLKIARPPSGLEIGAWPKLEDDDGTAEGAARSAEIALAAPPPDPQPIAAGPPALGAAAPSRPPPPVPLEVTERAPEPGRELTALLYRAAAAGATDLHVADGEPATLRVGGRLRPVSNDVFDTVIAEVLLRGLLTASVEARLASGRSVDLGLEVPTVGRFRANLYRCESGLAAAFRVLRRTPPPLSKLSLPVSLEPLLGLRHGLVVVCGPTGSGKSTTMASLVQERVQRQGTMLVTLEDPIEYVIEPGQRGSLVRQRQVGTHVLDFATGLRDALREDPDVILIGEMRDAESISLTLTAAETGHLVLASLHSRSAASAIERIVDVYPQGRQGQIRVQLADSLVAIVAQRLVPRASGTGLVPALEVLRCTHSVANLVREGKTAQIPSAIQSGRADGMISLERCLADLVRADAIRPQHAREVANDAGTLQNYLRP